MSDTIGCQEGAACGEWEADNSAVMGLWSGYMDSGYPLKAGTTNRIISICFWMKAQSLPGSGSYVYLYVHWNNLWVLLYNDGSGPRIALVNWYNGGANYEIDQHASVLSENVWYHVGIAYDGDAGTYRIRIWDDSDEAILGTDRTGTKANSVGIATGDVQLGYGYDGRLDDYLVFNRVLSAAEIDLIRRQQFHQALAAAVSTVATVEGDLILGAEGVLHELAASLAATSQVQALAALTHALAAPVTLTTTLIAALSRGTLCEHYTGTADFELAVGDGFKIGQTFTPQAAHFLTTVALKLYKKVTPVTGTLTLSIYATSGGLPTGVSLLTEEIDYSGFSTGWPGQIVEVLFVPGMALVCGVTYAMVLALSTGDGSIGIACQVQAGGGPYSRGVIVDNDNGLGEDGDWKVAQENMDIYFAEYGGPYWPWVEFSSTVAALSQMTAILNQSPPLAGRSTARSEIAGRIQYKAGTYVPAQVLVEPYPIPTLWQYLAGLGALEPGDRQWARAFGQGVQEWAAALEQWSQEHMTRVMLDMAKLAQEKTTDWVEA